LLFVIFSYIFILHIFSQNEIPQNDAKKIVEKIDELYRAKSSYSEIKMSIITPHWERTLQMKVWTEGMEKTFIRITHPPKEEMVGTLRIGNEMWNYLPKTNKVIKIPPSMMMSSWMGSDFTNDDLVKEITFVNDFYFQMTGQQESAKGFQDLLYVKCIPKEGRPIVWGKVIIGVRKEDYLPVIEEYYDEKGKIMRLMNFKDIRLFGDKKLPAVMEIIPQNKEGNKTVLEYIDLDFNVKVDENIFSLRNLRLEK
jgi:outer membrane lipoprotein-sorting protein